MSDDKKPQEQVEDQELNDLLDNALEDFNREPKFKSKVKDESNKSEKCEIPEMPEIPSSSEDVLSAMLGDDKWTQDFIKQAADQFENLMQNDTEDLGALHKAAQAVVSAMVDGESSQGDDVNADFRSAISQALKNLSATSETLQNSSTDFNEAELASMLDQASLGEGAGEVLPFIKGMMQSLLSKEILHPALKELVDKYPEWLEEHKATLTSADVQRYTKQLGLMQKACMELEKEGDDDSEDVKKDRFEIVFSLMQEMQACGLPPEELTGEQLNLFQ